MEVTFLKQKSYTDGTEVLILKNGLLAIDTRKAQLKASTTKRLNKINRENKRKKLISEYNKINNLVISETDKRRLEIIRLKLIERNFDNIRRSANRAKQELYDICKCNNFDYFVTLTFDKEKIDRLDDNATRQKYTRWAESMRKKFPSMYFVTAAEYHKKGGLHFHLLVGGIDFDSLQPEFWRKQTKGKNKGEPIYKINAWGAGFSTMTRIISQSATKHYICKYISKQHFDERFFNKKRYYTSHNIKRPIIRKSSI